MVGPRQHAIGLQILQCWISTLSLKPAIDQALDLAVTLRAVAQEKKDQCFPLARDDAEGGVEPAAGIAYFRGRRHI